MDSLLLNVTLLSGETDTSFDCDGCKKRTEGGWSCSVCLDFDLCQSCYENMAATIKKLPSTKAPHKLDHHMSNFPAYDYFDMYRQELVDRFAKVGIETQTSRCVLLVYIYRCTLALQ